MSGKRIVQTAAALAFSMIAGALLAISNDVYGGQQPRIGPRFPHEKTEHRKLECSKCHSVSTANPEVEEFPGHRSCVSCHNFAAMVFSPRPVAFCSICHDGRPVSKARPALFKFPRPKAASDFGIDFSHVGHLKPLPPSLAQRVMLSRSQLAANDKPKCTDCHQRSERPAAGTPEMVIETGHTSCFRCHGENPIKPPNMNQCAECHQLDGPRPRNLFNKVAGFKHADHEYDIRPKRKSELRVPRPADFLCAECHSSVAAAESIGAIRLPEENRCAQCHNGRLGLPDTLPGEVLRGLRNPQ